MFNIDDFKTTFNYNGHVIEHDQLSSFNYETLFRWSKFPKCVHYTSEELKDVSGKFDFYHCMDRGSVYHIENGLPQLYLRNKEFNLIAVRSDNALYLSNGSEAVRIDPNEVICVETKHPESENVGDGRISRFANAILKEAFDNRCVNQFELSGYDYLEMILPMFAKVVKLSDPSVNLSYGYITAHGDKAYGYKTTWLNHGIPFFHGLLLYLLTYTKAMDREKHLSDEWVISSYEKYRPMIRFVEESVGYCKVLR